MMCRLTKSSCKQKCAHRAYRQVPGPDGEDSPPHDGVSNEHLRISVSQWFVMERETRQTLIASDALVGSDSWLCALPIAEKSPTNVGEYKPARAASTFSLTVDRYVMTYPKNTDVET